MLAYSSTLTRVPSFAIPGSILPISRRGSPFRAMKASISRRYAHPTYLFISHLHHDHFDIDFLAEHLQRKQPSSCPTIQLDLLERALRADRLHDVSSRTKRTMNPSKWPRLRFITTASVAPTDGPLGDCGLVVDDGQTRIYNQNDSRPIDLERLVSLGPYDAHFLQFSGAIWYPMVYQFPDNMKQASRSQKTRERASTRPEVCRGDRREFHISVRRTALLLG